MLIVAVATLCVGGAVAQDKISDADLNAAPRDNVSAGSLSSRSPGNAIREAISRHNGLQAERLRGAGSQESTNEGSAATGNTNTGGGSLTDLLGGLGGSLGSGLAGTLNSVLNTVGGSAMSTGTSTNSGTTSTGGSGSTTGSRYTIEDLLRLRDTGSLKPQNTAQSINQDQTKSTANTSAATSASSGGAIARLTKTAQTAQTNNGSELKFRHRLVNSWLSTFFTALTFGFSSQDFIDTLADGIRPLIYPPTDDGSGDDGSDGGSDSGEGIEDVSSLWPGDGGICAATSSCCGPHA